MFNMDAKNHETTAKIAADINCNLTLQAAGSKIEALCGGFWVETCALCCMEVTPGRGTGGIPYTIRAMVQKKMMVFRFKVGLHI
ncbi:hypothetical protein FTW19_09395 [Terriglobus albidus]|uniref:Uncharacterized protein n=1 Tax=Terriglobus albidus TaxID=1592106 RepID=A0A5B9ECK0_9BACT|nr:hypothetical protein [Terriglobus albidus]QEE28191.1 hypothetical protein FTW19_09395 [Terriglobus albidus]